MSKVVATKIFSFDMAHRLPGHEGLCKNIHGHTYKLEVTVSRDTPSGIISGGPSEGMVIDFQALSGLVKTSIVDKLDHACIIYPEEQFDIDMLKLMEKHDMKVVELGYRPTAELMARNFFELLVKKISKSDVPEIRDLTVVKIRLWETPTAYAEVTDEV